MDSSSMFGMGARIPITTYYRTISVDNKPTTVIIGPNGEPVKLPESLDSLPKSDHFPTQRHRWNTNEEIASMLIAFDLHHEWMSKEVKIRPKSGSMLLYSRKKVRYRRDGYCWKKRKDGKTTREDHMKLKVQGMECIYGCYVHSAILPTFHRRCYWLLQNPDIVLVHYLNVPYPDDSKMMVTNSVSLWGEKKEWSKEELSSQLKPMFFSEEDSDLNSELNISMEETVESLVVQLLEKQRGARDTECSCPDSTCLDTKSCIHQVIKSSSQSSGRSRSGKSGALLTHDKIIDNNNQVSSTTGYISPKLSHHSHHQHQQQHHHHHQQQHHNSQSTASRLDTKPNNASCLIVGQGSPHNAGGGGGEHSRGQQVLLTLSQLNGNAAAAAAAGGLVILNSKTRAFESPSAIMPYIRLSSPQIKSPSPPGLENEVDAASRGDLGSVTAALNTLNNIQDFGLHHLQGTADFDTSPYPGVQPVTDSLLSGSESQKSDDSGSIKSEADHCTSGRLLDFKSAFSDLDSKPDMSFLDLSQDDLHRTLSANIPLSSNSAADHHNQQVKSNTGSYYRQNGRHFHQQTNNINPMVGGGPEATFGNDSSNLFYHNSAFDLNLDSFDILSDFPESLSHSYDDIAETPPGHGSQLPGGAINGGGGGASPPHHLGATIKTRTLEYRENLVTITDYTPNWSYGDGAVGMLALIIIGFSA